jgi:hypothetical protein
VRVCVGGGWVLGVKVGACRCERRWDGGLC